MERGGKKKVLRSAQPHPLACHRMLTQRSCISGTPFAQACHASALEFFNLEPCSQPAILGPLPYSPPLCRRCKAVASKSTSARSVSGMPILEIQAFPGP